MTLELVRFGIRIRVKFETIIRDRFNQPLELIRFGFTIDQTLELGLTRFWFMIDQIWD